MTRDAVDKKQKKQNLAPRNAPVQGRSRERSRQILDATSELLEKVGFDDLNTILIAKAVGISVGSLYHYFPNKHAILFAMGSRWLEEVEDVLNSMALWPIEEMPLDELVDRMLAANLKVYKQQKAINRWKMSFEGVSKMNRKKTNDKWKMAFWVVCTQM